MKQSDGFLLVHNLSDRLDLDGYYVVRRDDVFSIEPHSNADFAWKVLRLKGVTPAATDIPIDSLAEAIAWLRKAGEACVVEIPEKLEIAYVGYVRAVSADGFDFLHLTTAGERGSTGFYAFAECDLIGFGGDYERSLLLFDTDAHGGPPR